MKEQMFVLIIIFKDVFVGINTVLSILNKICVFLAMWIGGILYIFHPFRKMQIFTRIFEVCFSS